MLDFLWLLLRNEFGGTLSITRKTANTLITAAGFNTNYDEIEAVINGAIDADNIEDDSVSAAKLNADVVRANYGLVQHTDGSLYVDVSDTNPSLELTDGGLRAKVYGLINRTSNGLTFGRTGDVLFSSSATTPDGWSDVSATYANKFLRISATALSTGGTDSHTHSGTVDSHTLTAAEMPSHTHTFYGGEPSGSGQRTFMNATTRDDSYTAVTESAGSGGGHTHTFTTASADNVPAYVTLKAYQKS